MLKCNIEVNLHSRADWCLHHQPSQENKNLMLAQSNCHLFIPGIINIPVTAKSTWDRKMIVTYFPQSYIYIKHTKGSKNNHLSRPTLLLPLVKITPMFPSKYVPFTKSICPLELFSLLLFFKSIDF